MYVLLFLHVKGFSLLKNQGLYLFANPFPFLKPGKRMTKSRGERERERERWIQRLLGQRHRQFGAGKDRLWLALSEVEPQKHILGCSWGSESSHSRKFLERVQEGTPTLSTFIDLLP